MNTPNFDNIDRWLFDYVEGNLNSDQESTLENYILNHPELEVDLDMWRMSNIKMSDTFVNDLNIPKKTEKSHAYRLMNVFGILVILLIGRQIHFSETISPSNKGEIQVSQPPQNKNNELVKENTILSSNLIVNSENRSTYASINPSLNSTSNISDLNNYNLPLSSTGNFLSNAGNIGDPFDLKKLMIEKLNLNLDLKLSSKNTNEYSADNLELIGEEIESKSNISQFLGVKAKTKRIINKIDRLLSQNVALSNYRDHQYLIPQISSIDANLSSIGSVSQSRFQSTTRIRWMNSNQRKLSQQITFDTYARPIRSGVGAQVNYDYYADGSIKDWNGALIVSPKIALSRNIFLEPVAKLKIGNKLLDRDKTDNNSLAIFNTDSPQAFSYDTTQNIGRKLWYRDLDLGLTINTNIFYIGIQASNLLNHSENIYQNTQNTNYRTPTVYSLFAGTQYVSRNEKLSFHPYFYMRSVNKNKQYFGGFSLDLDKFYLGAAADFNDQYSASIGLSFDRFALILQSTNSYIPELNQHLYTHQLTIRINSDISKKTRRYITF
ncbi:MAG: type IX secretion system membrane protein PorP/SprF [Flavobacteriales bacterium]|nr:type IX secretion system membrane protein PorP/SprF [Flavobacteriales bacterium]